MQLALIAIQKVLRLTVLGQCCAFNSTQIVLEILPYLLTCCYAEGKKRGSHGVVSPYVGLGQRKRKPPVQFFFDDKVNSSSPSWVRGALRWVYVSLMC